MHEAESCTRNTSEERLASILARIRHDRARCSSKETIRRTHANYTRTELLKLFSCSREPSSNNEISLLLGHKKGTHAEKKELGAKYAASRERYRETEQLTLDRRFDNAWADRLEQQGKQEEADQIRAEHDLKQLEHAAKWEVLSAVERLLHAIELAQQRAREGYPKAAANLLEIEAQGAKDILACSPNVKSRSTLTSLARNLDKRAHDFRNS